MQKELTITTRELLREFKTYKDMIQERRVDKLFVGIGNGKKLEVTLKENKSSARNLVAAVRALKMPIKVKRPEIMNHLIRFPYHD